MSDATRTEMDAVEIAAFLDARSTGVLSLASGDDSYAVPVAYDYDPDSGGVYLRLGFGPGSQKRRFLDATDTVSFVVYDDTEDGWKSVVVQGHATELSETTLDSSVTEALNELDIPYFRVQDRPVDDLSFSIVRIEATKLTGVVEGGPAETADSS